MNPDFLLTSAPSRAAAQAALELGVEFPYYGVRATLPHNPAAYAKLGARHAAAAARLSDDPEYLHTTARKDRRISVLTELARNPHATQDCLLDIYRKAINLDHAQIVAAAAAALDSAHLRIALNEAIPSGGPARRALSVALGKRMLQGEDDVVRACAEVEPSSWTFDTPIGQFLSYGDVAGTYANVTIDPTVLERLHGTVGDEYVQAIFFGILRALPSGAPLENCPFRAGFLASKGTTPLRRIDVAPLGAPLSKDQAAKFLTSGDPTLMRIAVTSAAVSEELFVAHTVEMIQGIRAMGAGSPSWQKWDWTPKMVNALAEAGLRQPAGSADSVNYRRLAATIFSKLVGVDYLGSYKLGQGLTRPAAQYFSECAPDSAGPALMHWANREAREGRSLRDILDGFPFSPHWNNLATGFLNYAADHPHEDVVREGLLQLHTDYPELVIRHQDRCLVQGTYVASRLGDNVQAWKMLHSILDGQDMDLDVACGVALELSST